MHIVAESNCLNILFFILFYLIFFTFNMHVNYKIGSRMVLWSVSTARSVCQFEEVPAVAPYVWEREQENEERVSCFMFCHILIVYLVHPSFDLCLALFLSLLLMLHESVTERLKKSIIFFL